MFTYTTCRDCGELLQVTNFDIVHPGCTPHPTKLEALLDDYAAAVQMGDQPALEADLERAIKELEHRPPDLERAALTYASWGWPVFPLLPLGAINPRTGDISDGKKPATTHGFKDASTDTGEISTWWHNHPDHNIGLPTGLRFDVVDIDPRHGGFESLRQILEEPVLNDRGLDTSRSRIPDVHGRVTTAGGGLHLYVLATGSGNRGGWKPGIDIRGKGGYVVAPPSRLNHDRRWAWSIKPSPRILHHG